MKSTVTFLWALLLLAAFPLFSQSTKAVVVPLTPTVNVATPSVTLNWVNTNSSYVQLYRRVKDGPDWIVLLEEENSTTNSFVDTQVAVGQTYEYGIRRVTGILEAYGFALVPVEAPVSDLRGTLSVFVEAALEAPLATELQRLRNDLLGDGWDLQWHSVPANATVASVKAQIVADYDAFGTTTVFLFGEIPVPYSGDNNWDDQIDHQGAWPADAYYGDVDSDAWTDFSVNTSNFPIPPARPENANLPGDGKFDQNILPTESEIAVGRVDFSNLSESTFGITKLEMYRRYLEKNHKWRSKQYTVDAKVLVDDNLGYSNGEAFAANGYRNGNPLVGAANVIDGDFFGDSNAQSFLFAYGCGTGTYTGASGVGESSQFATETLNIVFSQLYGNYFGDWDYAPNSFMMSALASKGGILTCAWAGRPDWFTHHLGGGETMGYGTIQTLNSCNTPGYFNFEIDCGIQIALMGDPTVRAQIVSPVSNVAIALSCGEAEISWAASPQANVIGYLVYRSDQVNGGFERITPDPISDLAYTDFDPIVGSIYYMVKAVVREVTPSGIYFNTSTGIIANTVITATQPPVANLGPDRVLTCTTPSFTISACTGNLSCTLTNAAGTSFNLPASITQAGTYTLTVTDTGSGCSATDMMTVTLDNSAPPAPIVTQGAVNCLAQTIQLNGMSAPTGITYAWTGPNGFTASTQNVTATEGGSYTLTVTRISNGCSSSTTVQVQSPEIPSAVATGGVINCLNNTVQLTGQSTAAGASYAWTGPGGFVSASQNPTVSQPGNYLLTVTSASGCTGTAVANIAQQNNVPQASPSVAGILTCTNAQTTIMANPNMAGYNFAWSGPNGFTSTAQNPTVTLAGPYSLVLTDPLSGCTNSAAALVSQNANLPIGTTAELGQVNCAALTVQLLGNTATSPVSYAWTGPGGFVSASQNPTVAQSGNYNFTVTNTSNGCSATTAINVPDLSVPNVSATGGGNLTCVVNAVQLQGSTTTAGATLLWTGPNGYSSSVPNPSVSVVGNYVLTVTSPIGCTASSSVTVGQSGDFPVASPTSSGELTCLVETVQLSANPDQATGYSFEWSGPSGFISALQNPTVTLPGVYFVKLTDTNTGCVASYSTLVEQFELPEYDILPTSVELDCNNPAIDIDLWSACGQPGVTCTLNGQVVTQQTEITVGDNELVLTHVASGCTHTEVLDEFILDLAQPNLIVTGDLDLDCAGDLTTLTALSTTPGISLLWEGLNGNASQIVPTGNYSVTATGQNGCETSMTVTVTAPSQIVLSVSFEANCDGQLDAITLVTGGVAPYSFEFFPADPQPGAAFTLEVTDANGCVESISGNVPMAPPVLTATVSSTDETVLGANNGTATASPTGGVAPYSYDWSNGAATATATNLPPGEYTCIITDANGCETTVNVTIQPGVSATDELPGLRSLVLAPNPTDGRFELRIELENPLGVQVVLMDVAGRVLTETKLEKLQEKTWVFDLSASPSGVYFCKIFAEGKMKVAKVVKL